MGTRTAGRMRRMKLSRLGLGTTLAFVAFIASVASMGGGCEANYQEPCGVNGVKNGTCQPGPTCPSGSVEIPISDPSDGCPANDMPGTTTTAAGTIYICCD